MIYSKDINKALVLISDIHKNQVDKVGLPYILHLFEVANNTYKLLMDEIIDTGEVPIDDYIVTALLHDSIEDTDITFDELINLGFSNEVINALHYLTHNKNEPYMDYINKMKENKIAVVVKLADLLHNMDLNRFIGFKLNFERIMTKQEVYLNAYYELYKGRNL